MEDASKISELENELNKVREQAAAQKRLYEEQLRLLSGVFENSIEGIIVTDARGTILMVNPGFSSISGYSASEAVGMTPGLLKSGRHDKAFYAQMWSALEHDGRWQGEIWNRNKSGKVYVERLSISAIKNPEGKTTHYVGVFHDISDFKHKVEKYKHRALHDPLTGLPNRELLEDRLDRAIASAKRHPSKHAVLFLDLDGFKEVNDTYGHHTGDLLLQELGRLLKDNCREQDTVSRLGGDEFVLLMPDLHSVDDAEAGAQRIIDAALEPVVIDDQRFDLKISIGIALFPDDGSNPSALLSCADKAMYEAKKQKGSRYVQYARLAQEKPG